MLTRFTLIVQIIRLLFRRFIPFPTSTKSSLRNLVAVSRIITLRIERKKKTFWLHYFCLYVYFSKVPAWIIIVPVSDEKCWRPVSPSCSQALVYFGHVHETHKINLLAAETVRMRRTGAISNDKNSKIWRQQKSTNSSFLLLLGKCFEMIPKLKAGK